MKPPKSRAGPPKPPAISGPTTDAAVPASAVNTWIASVAASATLAVRADRCNAGPEERRERLRLCAECAGCRCGRIDAMHAGNSTISSVSAIDRASRVRPNDARAVAVWLLVCCALLFAMVVVGGVTRLTHSGLSITEWQPIVGTLPPLGDAEWNEAFRKYQATPEYN